jgi:predicted nucleic acid-binding protein
MLSLFSSSVLLKSLKKLLISTSLLLPGLVFLSFLFLPHTLRGQEALPELTTRKAKKILKESFQYFHDGDIMYMPHIKDDHIQVVVSSKVMDQLNEITLSYENIKYIEFEENNRLLLHSKNPNKLINNNLKVGRSNQKHDWSEMVILLKENTNRELVAKALDFLITLHENRLSSQLSLK